MRDNNREIIKLLAALHVAYMLIGNLDEPLREYVGRYLEHCQEELRTRLLEHEGVRVLEDSVEDTVFDLPDPYLSLNSISSVSDIWGDAK